MNLRSSKRPLEMTTEAKEFGHSENHSSEFEISQTDKTFKLKRVTPNSAFKIKLKPFLEANSQDDLKIPLSSLSNNGKSQLKRSLEEVYAQGDTSVSSSAYNTRSKSGQKIKKSKESTIKIRKCVKSNLEEDNKIQTEEQNAQPQEPQIVAIPILIAEEPYKSNIKNLSHCKTKTEKTLPNPPVKAPIYIQKLYERLASGDDEKYQAKFYSSFKEDQKTEHKLFDFPQLPVNFELPPPENKKGDFTYDLDIVTNQNQKERIKVSFQPGKVEQFSEIPNPMDTESRDSFFSNFHFTTDYRSGYAPVDIQAKQEKDFTYKNHFIKKKQSCANGRLKRVCGVSYVKKLECHQLNVNHIFPKLPPLVFQGSTGCVRLPDYQPLMKYATDKMLQEGPGHYFIVTILEAEDEGLMREYLYFPERRLKLTKGRVYFVRSLDALWFFFKDRHFVCVHLIYGDREFVKKSEVGQLSLHEVDEALRKSNIQIGFLCRKGLSGKKSFLKTFTEGLNREELGVDSDSEDEAPNQTLEELEKEKEKAKAEKAKAKAEKAKAKMAEGFISPKKKLKAEMRELKEREKSEKKEKREQEKREKQEQKLKERREKIMKLKSTKREKKEITLTEKQKHFFDKCKLKLQREEAFAPGVLKELFSNVDDIMQPYLKMLFVKGFTYSMKPNAADADQTVAATPSVVTNDCTDQITVDQTPRSHDENRFEIVSGLVTPSKITRDDESQEKQKDSQEDHISQDKSEEMNENKENKESEIIAMQVETTNEEAKEVTVPVQESKMNDLTVVNEQSLPEPSIKVHNDQIKLSPLQEFIHDIKKEPGKNMITLSTRVEMYTHEDSWKSADEHTKNLLYTFMLHITDLITEKFRNWTMKRSEIIKANTATLFSDLHQEIDLYEFDADTLETHMEEIPLDPVNLNWHFNPEIKNSEGFGDFEAEPNPKQNKYFKNLKSVSLAELQGANNMQKETSSLNLPLYTINTRDSFAFDLIEKRVEIEVCGRKVLKTDYYFDPVAYPSNFKVFFDKFPDLHVGVTTYNNFFSHEELLKIEERCYETERKFFDNHFLPMTGQMTATGDKVRRTKFFFGARYMWTKQQLSEPHSMVGAGIRTDVSERPRWMKDLVEDPLVQAGIMEKDFINAIAMNIYHDGREGLAQHFDDAVRFKQPIFSLRIFSDSRLSFGSQFYGFCNGAFSIPMPRGCITVLAEESYAANGVKHCVRPCDMTGKSAALILRQMHHKVFNEAQLYNEFVDFPTWFSTLSIQDKAVSYNDQKRLEADDLLKNKKKSEE